MTPKALEPVERVWTALTERCCSDPPNAKRCVMVSKDDLRASLEAAQPLPEIEKVERLNRERESGSPN